MKIVYVVAIAGAIASNPLVALAAGPTVPQAVAAPKPHGPASAYATLGFLRAALLTAPPPASTSTPYIYRPPQATRPIKTW